METETKRCNTCRETKCLTDFHRMASSKDGRQYMCKACMRERDKRRYAEDPAEAKARILRHRQKPEAKAAHLARVKADAAANPHKAWERSYRNRIRRVGKGDQMAVTSFTREQLIARYGDSCFHCGGPFEQLDHYPTPVSMGGAHSLDNCVPSCRPCNQHSWMAARSRSWSVAHESQQDSARRLLSTLSDALRSSHAGLARGGQ